jgi:hypothetical protein
MATIITEVYVSVDNLDFTRLDLHKDEAINFKYSKKELQDITKVFAPFSLDFTFPCSPKNKQALGFYGNTEVLKTNLTNEFNCKVYTNGILSQTGKLTLNSVKYKSNKATDFNASFNTTFLSLKDRLGEDTISELSSLPAVVSFKPDNVFNRLRNEATIIVDTIAVKYFIPLISNRRVWNYSEELNTIDNILFNASSSATSDKVINFGELRPVVSVLSLIDLIKKKYNLIITTPIEATNDITKLFMWCNGSEFTRKLANKFVFNKQFSNENANVGLAVSNFVDSSVKITIDSAVNTIEYVIILQDTVIGENIDTANATIDIVKKSDNTVLLSFDFEVKEGENTLIMNIPKFLFTANELEYFTFIKFDKPIFWNRSFVQVAVKTTFPSVVFKSKFSNSFNSDATGSYNIDLLTSLPEMKVIDFLTSYLKTFNLSIFDSSPNDENLFFLNPLDINTTGLVYSKREADYTRFADITDVEKSTNNLFNYYNFKHADSNYKSNADFEKQFDVKYGQTFFPLVKPTKANEFKVETDFSIIPPVLINGLSNTFTAYGFTSDAPEVDDALRFRYTPNLDEPTLFYSHGTELLQSNLSCQNVGTNGALTVSALNSYIKSLPYCKETGNSLGFSILIIQNVSFPQSLFANYYSQFINRLLNPNALSQTFTLNLPASEIYLNESTTVQGLGQTPTGFRLQNEVIIGETKFEILEATIDITTGKTKLILLNF